MGFVCVCVCVCLFGTFFGPLDVREACIVEVDVPPAPKGSPYASP